MRNPRLNQVLPRLQKELRHLLGDRLEGIYLYGSQARGDARQDSDIDVLIVMSGDFDYFQLLEITSDITWKLSLDNDVLITRTFVTKDQFDLANTPFLMNLQREAVPV